MGVYVKINHNDEVKLGTCEDMYYCTYEQGQGIKHNCHGDLSAGDFDSFDIFRWRFPFPDEADIAIGHHKDAFKGFLMYAPLTVMEISHTTILMDIEKNGAPRIRYRIDCPVRNSLNIEVFRWDHAQASGNFFFEVVQQKPCIEGGRKELQTVVRCPYCGSLSRLSREEVERLAAWASDKPAEWQTIIDIMLAGYSRWGNS
jgi:hypothetical protein